MYRVNQPCWFTWDSSTGRLITFPCVLSGVTRLRKAAPLTTQSEGSELEPSSLVAKWAQVAGPSCRRPGSRTPRQTSLLGSEAMSTIWTTTGTQE